MKGIWDRRFISGGNNLNSMGVYYPFSTYSVGGTLSGLNGDQLILQNNAGDDLTVATNGSFTFATALDDGSAYTVSVLTQPSSPNQICSVTNGSGTLAGADVSDVAVTCTINTYTVGGSVSGLTPGDNIALQNNGGDDLTLSSDGAFTFATALADGSSYNVSLLSQPITLNCTLANANGNLNGADVTNVQVNCATVPAQIQISSSLVDFGSLLLGQNQASVITVTNSGTVDLTLNSIGGLAAPFAVSGGSCDPLPMILTPGNNCTIEVTYNPTTPGNHSTNLSINSNAPGSPTLVELRGNGFAPATPVPTLSQWALLLLLSSVLFSSCLVYRRKLG